MLQEKAFLFVTASEAWQSQNEYEPSSVSPLACHLPLHLKVFRYAP